MAVAAERTTEDQAVQVLLGRVGQVVQVHLFLRTTITPFRTLVLQLALLGTLATLRIQAHHSMPTLDIRVMEDHQETICKAVHLQACITQDLV